MPEIITNMISYSYDKLVQALHRFAEKLMRTVFTGLNEENPGRFMDDFDLSHTSFLRLNNYSNPMA